MTGSSCSFSANVFQTDQSDFFAQSGVHDPFLATIIM
jgi:hypothetical protein